MGGTHDFQDEHADMGWTNTEVSHSLQIYSMWRTLPHKNHKHWDFPDGTVVKASPSNVKGRPVQELRSHMPRGQKQNMKRETMLSSNSQRFCGPHQKRKTLKKKKKEW